ncbi:lipocalin family protein [Asticcacaulis sp. EMRT-3]|uniref:lipocalin family protein n=1 Tax=Asticcacaulis sp. EMRT-3 TaxID=3040349 RepID=UPI0024AEAF15|nr:lipocalin family protein [Asticcacaulis sp. EMRT-3]MDI7775161.1 lipocalin family protein [Asticcacaulis sp. EMRT-3]
MRKAFPFLISAVLLSGCASVPLAVGPAAQTPTIDMAHYSGTWLEIARHPMWITNNCVAGYTTYTPGTKPGEVAVEDGCHDHTPDGKLKVIHGRGVLRDAGAGNAQLSVHYPFFITFNYWTLYEAPDHSWFISADPKMHNLWIYSRNVPSDAERAVMVQKAQSLGYDVSQLEFPAQ